MAENRQGAERDQGDHDDVVDGGDGGRHFRHHTGTLLFQFRQNLSSAVIFEMVNLTYQSVKVKGHL